MTFRRTQKFDKNGIQKLYSDTFFTKQPKRIEKIIKEYSSQLVEGTTLIPITK